MPLAAIDALLLYVAWTLINIPRIREIVRFSRAEATSLLVTWGATMFIPLEFAIVLGVSVSLFFYLHQTARPQLKSLVPWGAERRFSPLDELDDTAVECPQLKLVRMEGEVYFGAAQHVENQLKAYRKAQPGQKHLLVMARSMNAIDLAGLRLWWQEWRLRRQAGGGLYWHRPRTRVINAVGRADMPGLLSKDNVFNTKHDAIAAIVPQLDPDICLSCRARIFDECAGRPGAVQASAAQRAASA